MARNHVGLAKYCVKKGYLTPSSIDDALAGVALIEKLNFDKSGGDAAEREGASGVIVIKGEWKTVSENRYGEKAWCRHAGEGWHKLAVHTPLRDDTKSR